MSLRHGSLKMKGFSKESYLLYLHPKNSWKETWRMKAGRLPLPRSQATICLLQDIWWWSNCSLALVGPSWWYPRLYLFYMKKRKPSETKSSTDVHGNKCTNTGSKKILEREVRNRVSYFKMKILFLSIEETDGRCFKNYSDANTNILH